MEYIRSTVRNAVLTTEAKLFLFRDYVSNVISIVGNQFFKFEVKDNAKNLEEVGIKDELSTTLEVKQSVKTKTCCNFYSLNCIECVSLKQHATCHSLNCSVIVLLKKFISCLINFLCFPFLPCAVIFFPNSFTNCVNSNVCSICPCHSKPCFCIKIQDDRFLKLCSSPFSCVVIFCIVFTFGCFALWIVSPSSLFVIDVLIFFENLNQAESMLIFVFLFTVVSFPVMWGYVFLNLAAGYLYGFWIGLLVVIFAVTIGLAISYLVCKRYFSNCVMTILKNRSNFEQIEAILQVINGSSGLKVIALTRLTPVPFGLQNGLFSVTNVSLKRYLLASDVGLLPTQILNCYIASKFRSFDQVVDQENPKGYLLFFCQIVVGIALTAFVVQRARKELASALQASGKTMQKSELDLQNSSVSSGLVDVISMQPSNSSTDRDNEMKKILIV